jgi:hypothetical protein
MFRRWALSDVAFRSPAAETRHADAAQQG